MGSVLGGSVGGTLGEGSGKGNLGGASLARAPVARHVAPI